VVCCLHIIPRGTLYEKLWKMGRHWCNQGMASVLRVDCSGYRIRSPTVTICQTNDGEIKDTRLARK
jgi:hypothetical protein